MKARTLVVVVLALPALAACSNHYDKTDPSRNTGGCTGHRDSGLEIAQGSAYDLANGVVAELDSTDLTGDPPTVTLGLQNVPASETDAAAHLGVGDTFRVKGTTYRVNLVCQHVAGVEQQ